ncbi:MAG: single-stranded DNA-binding protein, partial [Parachlamydiales bacterium]
MNIITVAGRLGADPESRFTPNGQKVTTLRVATTSRKSSKEETIWWRVTVWGENFDKMISFLKKGSAVVIVGELHKPEIFNDREGKPQISMNITASNIMFSPFGKSEKSDNSSNSSDRKEQEVMRQDKVKSEDSEEEYSAFSLGSKKEGHD